MMRDGAGQCGTMRAVQMVCAQVRKRRGAVRDGAGRAMAVAGRDSAAACMSRMVGR